MFAYVLLQFLLKQISKQKLSKANFTNKSLVDSSGFPHYSLDLSDNTCLAVISHSFFSSSSHTLIHGKSRVP